MRRCILWMWGWNLKNRPGNFGRIRMRLWHFSWRLIMKSKRWSRAKIGRSALGIRFIRCINNWENPSISAMILLTSSSPISTCLEIISTPGKQRSISYSSLTVFQLTNGIWKSIISWLSTKPPQWAIKLLASSRAKINRIRNGTISLLSLVMVYSKVTTIY